VIELLDLGKRNVDLGHAGGAPLRQHGRQAVQGLRPEHDIHIRCTRHDGRAFLAGHAAPHAYHQVGVGILERLDAAEVGKYLFLGFLAHRAGVEQDHVRIFGRVRFDQTFGTAEYVDHFVGIVLVHLAAEGFNVDFFDHGFAVRSG